MRSAIVAVAVLVLIVAGLAFAALASPPSAHRQPPTASQRVATSGQPPPGPGAVPPSRCPAAGGPDLTGCPDGAAAATVTGSGDFARLEKLPPQGWP